MVHLTNIVVQTDLRCSLDLPYIARCVSNIQYDPGKFTGAVWRNRIGGNLLVFHTGKLVCNGNKTLLQARQRVRKYCRILQKLGFPVKLTRIDVVTISAVHKLSARLCFKEVCDWLGAEYDPEILNAAILKKNKINFNCFQSGSVVITGIKRSRDLDEIVYPTLIELELCTS